jgi:hypothetical protein
MVWGEAAIVGAGRLLIPVARKLWSLAQRRYLSVRLEPIEDDEMLRAFSVTLTNKSNESLRLDSIFVRKPGGSLIAVRFHFPMMVVGEPRRPDPWRIVQRYSFNSVLDPDESFDCEIGIPKGFAVTASRKPPITIAVDLTTFGERERKIVQVVKRSISVE